MKKHILITFFIAFYSCKAQETKMMDVEFRVTRPRIKEGYLDIKTKEGHIKHQEALALTSTCYFKFTKGGKLFVEPEFGKRFFNDSIFTYKIEGDIIKLEGSSGKKELVLSGRREDDFIDVSFKNDIYESLGLERYKKTSKSNNQEIVGVYNLMSYGLGHRFQNDPEAGHDFVQSKLKQGPHFEFKDNDSLIMAKEFGEAFFNESAFYYAYDGKTLSLDGKMARFEIPLNRWSTGALKLFTNDGYFENLVFVKPKNERE